MFRTVYSVLNRSPDELVEEIILVDDASTLPHLGDRLAKVTYSLTFSSKLGSGSDSEVKSRNAVSLLVQ